jgi:hypothetical protein
MADAPCGLLQRQPRIERGAGEILRRGRQRPQASLGLRLRLGARLIDVRAFGRDSFQHGAFGGGKILGIVARRIVGGVLTGAFAQMQPLLQRRSAEALRRLGRALIGSGLPAAVHCRSRGGTKARNQRFSKGSGGAITPSGAHLERISRTLGHR